MLLDIQLVEFRNAYYKHPIGPLSFINFLSAMAEFKLWSGLRRRSHTPIWVLLFLGLLLAIILGCLVYNKDLFASWRNTYDIFFRHDHMPQQSTVANITKIDRTTPTKSTFKLVAMYSFLFSFGMAIGTSFLFVFELWKHSTTGGGATR